MSMKRGRKRIGEIEVRARGPGAVVVEGSAEEASATATAAVAAVIPASGANRAGESAGTKLSVIGFPRRKADFLIDFYQGGQNGWSIKHNV